MRQLRGPDLMNEAPKIVRERSGRRRVFISWNGGRSWWEVVPEVFDGDVFVEPHVTIEYFVEPQGNFEPVNT